MRAFELSVIKSVFCAESSVKPELNSPPHAPAPSANADDAVSHAEARALLGKVDKKALAEVDAEAARKAATLHA